MCVSVCMYIQYKYVCVVWGGQKYNNQSREIQQLSRHLGVFPSSHMYIIYIYTTCVYHVCSLTSDNLFLTTV